MENPPQPESYVDFKSLPVVDLYTSLRAKDGQPKVEIVKEISRRVEIAKELEDGEWVDHAESVFKKNIAKVTPPDLPIAGRSAAAQIEGDYASSGISRLHPELVGLFEASSVINTAKLQKTWLESRVGDLRQPSSRQELVNMGFKDATIDRILARASEPSLDFLGIGPEDAVYRVVGSKVEDKEVKLDERKLTESFREALGKPDAEKVKVMYLEAERNMQDIAIGVELPAFLVEASDKEISEWKARTLLSSACARKIAARNLDELSQNPEAKKLTWEQVSILLDMPGVIEAISLEAAIISQDLNPNAVLSPTRDCPSSIFKILNDTEYKAFRQAKIDWLVTRRGLSLEEAVSAENVSRNYLYLADLLEDYDSKYNQSGEKTDPDHTYATPALSTLKSMTVWQGMHLEERLEAKTGGSESWGSFGAWATKRQSKGEDISRERPLPPSLFPSALESPDASRVPMIDIYIANGKELIKNPYADVDKPDLSGPGLKEGPFAYYCNNILNPAAFILNVIANPGEFKAKMPWATLGNAFRNCKVPIFYRERIVMGIFGVDIDSKHLKPARNGLNFGIYKKAITQVDPTFWKE